jgi:hypothetical protein
VAMRGNDQICGRLFSYIDLEARVETEHPLRAIREIANFGNVNYFTSTTDPLTYSTQRGANGPSIEGERNARSPHPSN